MATRAHAEHTAVYFKQQQTTITQPLHCIPW